MFSSRLITLNSSVRLIYDEVVSFQKIVYRNTWSFEQKKTVNSSCLIYPSFNLVDKTLKRKFSQCDQHLSQRQQDVKEDSMPQPTTKLLKISIIGTPNTGKSTFINQIVGRRVSCIIMKFDLFYHRPTLITARLFIILEYNSRIFSLIACLII